MDKSERKFKSLRDIEQSRDMARGNIAMSKRELDDIPNRVKELEAVIARAEKYLIELDEAEEVFRDSQRFVIVYFTEEEADVDGGIPPRWFSVRAVLLPEDAVAKCERVELNGKDYQPSEFDAVLYQRFHHFLAPNERGKWVECRTTRREALEAALAAIAKVQADYPEAIVMDNLPEYIYKNEGLPEPADTEKWSRCI